MKILAKLLTLLAILLFTTCTGTIIYFEDYITCDEDNEMVEFARSLSQERLSDFYLLMEESSAREDLADGGYLHYGENAVTLDPPKDTVAFRVSPQVGSMELRNCLDHGVFMKFKGVGLSKKDGEEREVILSWGEYSTSGSEVIWPK